MACFFNNFRGRKRLAVRIAIDVTCILTLAAGILSIKFGTEPYHRGFFCDDESIQHPVLPDTITVPVVVLVGITINFVMIIGIEFLLRRDSEKFCMASKRNHFTQKESWMVAAYTYIAVFVFGMGVTDFLTEIGKVSIGRLRPHFLTLCAPDMVKTPCSQGYITADVCTSTDTAKLREARLSFPSGHSSFAMFCMMYSMLYLHARVSCKFTKLLKPLLLLVFFSMGFYTCLSRISDYMHHWSDVLSGAILGIVVCISVVRGLTDLAPNLCGVGCRGMRSLGSLSNNKADLTSTRCESGLSTTSVDESHDQSHVVNLDCRDY